MTDKIAKTAIPMGGVPFEGQPPTVASQMYRIIYSNTTRLRASTADLQVTFGVVADRHQADETLKLVVEDQVAVVMPYAQAAQLVKGLNQALEDYKNKFGQAPPDDLSE